MTFRRLTKGRGRSEGRESLLLNSEPAGDAFGGVKKGYRTASSNSGSSSGGSEFEVAMTAQQSLSTGSRLPPSNRFQPQHRPRGSPTPKEEIGPSEGVLQFVPAYDESAPNDASWDAILDDGAAAFPPRFSGSRSEVGGHASSSNSRFRRKATSTVGRPAFAHSNSSRRRNHHETATEVNTLSSRTKGPRIARLASLFTSKAAASSNNLGTVGFNNKQSSPNTTDSTLPNSPSRSSSSGDYVNWPGTQRKDGDTVAIQSSYEDSDIGPNNISSATDTLPFEDDLEPSPEEKAWMDSSAFQDISRVHSDPPGEKADDDVYLEHEKEPEAPHGVPMNRLFHNNNTGWDVNVPSPSRSSVSKTSSAYFADNDVRPMAFPSVAEQSRRQAAAANIMRGAQPHPPTEETLAINNSLSPPHRTPSNAQGYRGLLDKTQDVPNLMDDADSDSMASSTTRSSRACSTASGGPSYYNDRPRMGITMPSVNEDAESDVFDEISKYSLGHSRYSSEVFDGISQSVVEDSRASLSEFRNTTASVERRHQPKDPEPQQRNNYNNNNGMKVVLLGGGLTTIQTTAADFSKRITASDYDETLTNSDIDVPSFQEMAAAGRSVNDSASVIDVATSVDPSDGQLSSFGARNSAVSSERYEENFQSKSLAWGSQQHHYPEPDQESSRRANTSNETSYQDDESAFFSDFYSGSEGYCNGDLSEYYVQPSLVKKLVRKYRRMCHQIISNCQTYDEADRTEDEKQAFALFEMRSRIMEKDIERGLERRGGTTVVDDLVTTNYNRRAMRIRDAVIVSKAWRDGASPRDVINTAHLTERAERAYFICRPNRNRYRSQNNSLNSSPYSWEEVAWIDDADFLQYKCPSLGPRSLRGSEMFTIGDCQSILLKLTNEACMELRSELNEATARQIEAEELMREEGDFGDGMMTEAEMTYLTSMEEVKTISKKLVVAEKAFALVRDRIKNLVAKYEKLLVKIDNEEMATESVVTGVSSCYSSEYASHVSTDYEERVWQRRQQRAEISAELAAREAILSRQQADYSVQEEKQRELEQLHQRLMELQSEPSTVAIDRQRSALLARAIAAKRQSSGEYQDQPAESQSQQLKGGGVDSVKQRFRERMAARMRQQQPTRSQIDQQARQDQRSSYNGYSRNLPVSKPQEMPRPAKPQTSSRPNILSLAGEEMFQHLDFYERSLKAVESQREVR